MHACVYVACSRLSVVEDERKRARGKTRESSLVSSLARFRSSPTTESLEQASGYVTIVMGLRFAPKLRYYVLLGAVRFLAPLLNSRVRYFCTAYKWRGTVA